MMSHPLISDVLTVSGLHGQSACSGESSREVLKLGTPLLMLQYYQVPIGKVRTIISRQNGKPEIENSPARLDLPEKLVQVR